MVLAVSGRSFALGRRGEGNLRLLVDSLLFKTRCFAFCFFTTTCLTCCCPLLTAVRSLFPMKSGDASMTTLWQTAVEHLVDSNSTAFSKFAHCAKVFTRGASLASSKTTQRECTRTEISRASTRPSSQRTLFHRRIRTTQARHSTFKWTPRSSRFASGSATWVSLHHHRRLLLRLLHGQFAAPDLPSSRHLRILAASPHLLSLRHSSRAARKLSSHPQHTIHRIYARGSGRAGACRTMSKRCLGLFVGHVPLLQQSPHYSPSALPNPNPVNPLPGHRRDCSRRETGAYFKFYQHTSPL